MTQKVVIFQSKEEAEAATGYFYVYTIMITWELSDRIKSFIEKNDLRTWGQYNAEKTSYNTSTLNFTHKRYDEKQRAYLSKPGAWGIYKQAKHFSERLGKSATDGLNPLRLKELEELSPSLEQMYFWIARKYPRHILWMQYSMDPSSKLSQDDLDQMPF